ncbi:Arylsulfatase A [Aliiroseovarius halocynthiae]|uniref:Sulfatase-like hydrolase/transferase n=1 Tax=Aliiroseovarius halocynthiae TaxID=985055 RepID=A0A545SQ23_9RHOB|nr:sulfatase-like hydrolase/transferase [Aliiroseovarius halocynthiae]TQV67083.1 sulfatase-like hydrolase/transferase [Aliiroseovarius halocynthiae]SMR82194.1 Arylsulfatase A [Aliiroseovarius halocynthiae]
MTAKKNVLFIIIDQLRADCLHGALADHVDLPNLRALMDESVTFKRHFSVVNPCGPSRASILTGQYAMNHRSVRNGTPLRHDIPTIASEMRKAGYLPMLFGYTDTSQDPRVFAPTDPAVQTYEQAMSGFVEQVEMRLEMSYPWRSYLMSKGHSWNNYWQLHMPGGDGSSLNAPAVYSAEDSDTAFLTNQFLDRMPAYADQSWFAHLTYIRPHPPLVAPVPYNDMYDPATLPAPARVGSRQDEAAVHPFFDPALANEKAANFVLGAKADDSDETLQTLRAVYLGLATEVDHHIGRVVAFLKDSGQWDDTLLVVTADHGEMLGDHHAWGKHSVYDAAYHTPLIIHAPGCDAGHVVDVPTESIDLTPTILSWVGQEVPNAMDGRSLLPFLLGNTPDEWRDYSFSELDFGDPVTPTLWQKELGTDASTSCVGILRDERFTLIEFAADLPPLLFDHDEQGELQNVAENPAFATDLARLTRQMLRHRMRNMDHTLSYDMITEQGPKRAPRYPENDASA